MANPLLKYMRIKQFLANHANISLITLILILAASLRLWRLGSIPPGLTADEASLGYNAYSIINSGRDFWGETFPIIFKSFGDYTPGLYVYLSIPFIAIFGLNEISVRLLSAISGILIVYLFYLISGQVLKYSKYKEYERHGGIIAAFIASVNPL